MSHRLPLTIVALTSLGTLAAAPACADMPNDIAVKIAAIGRVVASEKTAEIYTPLQEKEPYAGIKVARDVSYGPDPRTIADIFMAEGASGARPVLMFVHGGQYTRGSKHNPGSAFYDNVMLWAARNGMIGVNVEYRLAPANPWPAAAQDMGTAVRFVAEHAATYGADPARIFLMGHSAGATHVATYVAHPEFHGPKGIGIAGAILSSTGAYNLTTDPPSESRTAYFGADLSKYAERSALPGLRKTLLPLMASYAELDPPPIERQFVEFKATMCESPRGCVRTIMLPKHSHMSAAYSINTADKTLTNQILEFVKVGK